MLVSARVLAPDGGGQVRSGSTSEERVERLQLGLCGEAQTRLVSLEEELCLGKWEMACMRPKTRTSN